MLTLHRHGTDNRRLHFSCGGSYSLLEVAFGSGSHNYVGGGTYSLSSNNWHHLCVTCDNFSGKLYIDNVYQDSFTMPNLSEGSPQLTYTELLIGTGINWNNSAVNVMSGGGMYIHNVKIYNYAITAHQVQYLYNE